MTVAPVRDRTESRHMPIGEAGRNVIANIEQLRAARSLSFRQLSARLGAIGHPIQSSAIHRVTQGKRRIDADDLVAIAAVLGVSPADLLAPPDPEILAEPAPAQREVRNLAARLEEVLAGSADPMAAARLKRALQRVRLEVAEVLEESAGRPGKAG